MDGLTHTHTHTHTLIPSRTPPLCRAVMCIVYLHNHLPFILSLFSSPPSLSLSLGKPVMIITEYMENGSLDAFLRVSHAFLSAHMCACVWVCDTTVAVLIPSYRCNVIPPPLPEITRVRSQTFALIFILSLIDLPFFPTWRLAQVFNLCASRVHYTLGFSWFVHEYTVYRVRVNRGKLKMNTLYLESCVVLA